MRTYCIESTWIHCFDSKLDSSPIFIYDTTGIFNFFIYLTPYRNNEGKKKKNPLLKRILGEKKKTSQREKQSSMTKSTKTTSTKKSNSFMSSTLLNSMKKADPHYCGSFVHTNFDGKGNELLSEYEEREKDDIEVVGNVTFGSHKRKDEGGGLLLLGDENEEEKTEIQPVRNVVECNFEMDPEMMNSYRDASYQ